MMKFPNLVVVGRKESGKTVRGRGRGLSRKMVYSVALPDQQQRTLFCAAVLRFRDKVHCSTALGLWWYRRYRAVS